MDLATGTPAWLLTMAYWLHMAATVIWIGGLFFQSILLPGAIRKLTPLQQASFLETLRKRFEPIAWLCLATLLVTGLMQMTASENYSGLLSIENDWGTAIFIKHLFVGGMVALGIAQTWWLGPKMSKHALRLAQGKTDAGETHKSYQIMVRINFLLSLLVLAFTAIARTA
jgi:putative copper export protein